MPPFNPGTIALFERMTALSRSDITRSVATSKQSNRLATPAHPCQLTERPLPQSVLAPPVCRRLAAQGFTEEFLGDDHPPATHYHLSGEEGGFCAEFVTPLTGSDYDRKENRTATTGIGGIVSQRLRYIEILLCQPWTVDFEIGSRTVKIQIPNPVSFLAQKLLIHGKRSREDRAKDIL